MGKNNRLQFQKLPSWIDPEKIFTLLYVEKPASFWLDSSLVNEASRFSYMGIPSEIATYSLSQNIITITTKNKTEHLHQDIFSYLDEQLQKRTVETPDLPFDFSGGYVGYFGYELKALCGAQTTLSSPYPDSLWYFVDRFIVFDHKEKEIYLVCLNNPSHNDKDWLKKTYNTITLNPVPEKYKQISERIISSKIINKADFFHLSRDKKQYRKDIQTCKSYLAKGESYQICLTNTIKDLNISY